MEKKRKKPDQRAYTFMIIPHRGEKTYSINLPAATLKKVCTAVLCVLLVFGGLQLRQMIVVKRAEAEQAELAHLRGIKDSQEAKLQQLTKITEEVQQEMAKVAQLESEVKRSLGTDDKTVSRSGVDRTMPGAGRGVAPISMNADEVLAAAQLLKTNAIGKQGQLELLNDRLIERNAIRAATPSGWPASGEVTSRFGGRLSPGGIGSSSHKGLDIAGAYGSAVCATADGVVETATWFGGYGHYILINHGYGLKTAYAHNSALLVTPGQRVRKGEVIARMGNSGVSTGTHLHYEVQKNGVQVDPANFI